MKTPTKPTAPRMPRARVSQTPRTDALEQSIPESAILCEHFYEMQKLAHEIEEELATAKLALMSIKSFGNGTRYLGYWSGKECANAANTAIDNICQEMPGIPRGYEIITTELPPEGECSYHWRNSNGREGYPFGKYCDAIQSALIHASATVRKSANNTEKPT